VQGCSHGRQGMGGRLGQDSGSSLLPWSSSRTGGEAGWELAAAVDDLQSRVARPAGELVTAVVAGWQGRCKLGRGVARSLQARSLLGQNTSALCLLSL
jgi:hypothetical protein